MCPTIAEKDDPIFRPLRRQIIEGIGWGIVGATLAFRFTGHGLAEIGTMYFFIHFGVIIVASVLIFVGIRRGQQAMRHWVKTREQQR
jgi:hypothetical protein